MNKNLHQFVNHLYYHIDNLHHHIQNNKFIDMDDVIFYDLYQLHSFFYHCSCFCFNFHPSYYNYFIRFQNILLIRLINKTMSTLNFEHNILQICLNVHHNLHNVQMF